MRWWFFLRFVKVSWVVWKWEPRWNKERMEVEEEER